MELTEYQKRWLLERGGRTAKDIVFKEGKPYIFMGNCLTLTGMELMPLPKGEPPKLIDEQPHQLYEPQQYCKGCNGERFRDKHSKRYYFRHTGSCRFSNSGTKNKGKARIVGH